MRMPVSSKDFSEGLFASSTPEWRHSIDGDLRRFFEHLLQSNTQNTISWRPDRLRDFRDQDVPSSAERLLRWDSRAPYRIFAEGFQPLGLGFEGSQFDLALYDGVGQSSPFVSTTRCFQEAGAAQKWRPTGRYDRGPQFEYEVFAYGGIDVGASLGSHQQQRQREIIFPGGIRRGFVRSAIEYGENGRAVRFWMNEHFDASLPGPSLAPHMGTIPNHLIPDNIEIVFWPSTVLAASENDDFRAAGLDDDDLMRIDGIFEEITHPALFFPTLNQRDAPTEGHTYAINVFGSSMVLTCKNKFDLVLDVWRGDETQCFQCVIHQGYMGFVCNGAGNGEGRYLGYDTQKQLVCKAERLLSWERIYPRADSAGGFMLWMSKDKGLAPVSRIDRTTLKMAVLSSTRFGFTRLDNDVDDWGAQPTSTTDVPTVGHQYAIKIYGTSKAFTCINGNELRLRTWSGSDSQRFLCTMRDGNMGFVCKGAAGGQGRYLGYRSDHTLACVVEHQLEWEHIHTRADPAGGFRLWMQKDNRLSPVAQVSEGKMKATGERPPARVSFMKIA